MNNKRDILVIIPAYNEENSIAKVISDIKRAAPFADVLVVDDGSIDKTSEVSKAAGAVVLIHPFNMGYGVALQTGYKHALKRGYEYIIQLDGDGQHDPKYINDLLSALKQHGVDVIIGSRFIEKHAYKTPFIRRIGMIIFSTITSFIVGQRITDSTSGFQALNRKAIEFLSGDFYPFDFPDADVIILLHFAGFRMREIPVLMNPPPDNKTMHGGFKKIYYIFKMFLSIIMTTLREKPNRKEI